MVMRVLSTLLICLSISLFAQDVQVVGHVDDGVVHIPLKGTITITHSSAAAIGQDSFRLGDRSLEVELIKEVHISPDLRISIYRFSLPPAAAGLYVLPEISVVVGTKKYRSIPSTYTVKAEESLKSQIPPQAESPAEIVLKLEPILIGTPPFYPGEELIVGYRIKYTFNFSLTKEELPLLEAKGFRNIGGKQVEEYREAGLQVFEVQQKISAMSSGNFSFGPSLIEGRAYQIRGSKKIFSPSIYRSEIEPIEIIINAFPEKDRPIFFTGAVGKFEFQLSLQSSKEVMVGDKIQLLAVIRGEQHETVSLPDFSCQPGFSGFFRFSDLPPLREVKDDLVSYLLELRPLTALVQEVPSAAFTYFDPEKRQYQILRSQPIPLHVLPEKKSDSKREKLPSNIPEAALIVPISSPFKILPVLKLSSKDICSLPLGTWQVLFLIPLSALGILLQIRWRAFIKQRIERGCLKSSGQLLSELKRTTPNTAAFYAKLQILFDRRLEEIGPDQSNRLRTLWQEIERRRFAGTEEGVDEELLNRVKRAFTSQEE